MKPKPTDPWSDPNWSATWRRLTPAERTRTIACRAKLALARFAHTCEQGIAAMHKRLEAK